MPLWKLDWPHWKANLVTLRKETGRDYGRTSGRYQEDE
jgi:hypothetical protein